MVKKTKCPVCDNIVVMSMCEGQVVYLDRLPKSWYAWLFSNAKDSEGRHWAMHLCERKEAGK